MISSLDNFNSKAFDKEVINDKKNDADPPKPEPPEAKPKVFNSI